MNTNALPTQAYLEECIEDIEIRFKNDPKNILKFVEELGEHFRTKYQEHAGTAICLPKKAKKASNGFNAFNSEKRLCMYQTALS